MRAMKERSKRLLGIALLIIVFAGAGAYYCVYVRVPPRPVSAEAGGWDERHGEDYFRVNDESNRLIFTTGHAVTVGDEFIAEDETRCQVVTVAGNVATAKSLGKMESLVEFPAMEAEAKPSGTSTVGIYHTHSDESYLPSDGSDSIPAKGGVLRVGTSMASALDKKGVKVIHSLTPHDPHDAGAYDRSRRTAAQILRDKPMALFDVHRDAGPAEPYLKDIPGQGEVAKAMIVVGRTNPKSSANLSFARRLMNAVNAKYPGLVKGIFMGKAGFNQDLYDRSLLLEMGTEKTTREAAEKGAALIGSVVPSILGVSGGPSGGSTGRAIAWILGLSVAGTFVYLWVSTGSWGELRAKVMGWFGAGGVRVGGGRKNGGAGTN